jgi:undecaprenyl-diphosphatase
VTGFQDLPFVSVLAGGLVQGITEFFPVSSSAHLALLGRFFPVAGEEAMDVLFHMGTLGVVLWFFRHTLIQWCRHLGHVFSPGCPRGREIRCLVVASLPVVILGAVVHSTGLEALRQNTTVTGVNAIVFGLWLGVADHPFTRGAPERSLETMTLKDSFLVGLFQAMAVIPGVSRSGACLTGLRTLKFERSDSVRWSFLMSLPAVGGALVLKAPLLVQTVLHLHTGVQSFLAVPLVSFLAGLGCLHLMTEWVRRHSLKAFVAYRITLGIILLVWT